MRCNRLRGGGPEEGIAGGGVFADLGGGAFGGGSFGAGIAVARRTRRAFLERAWYCCAEPTRDQLVAIGGVAPAPAVEKVVAADGFV